ncbi:MAG: exodeoxyribonuclease VII small subunit [Fibrobacteraceae bacterium]|nr:exodeoxyribonuclease VII small subunit [Fibrobacteraceae bacterium]
MSRLEEILQKIDQSEMGIDELASQVEEATLLLRQCRRILTETEEKVQQSLRTLDGELDSNV